MGGMIGTRKITIERTWSGMVGGWLCRSDYRANEILARLDELEEALSLPTASFAAKDRETAQRLFHKWNQTLIRYTERDAMYRELGRALDLLYGVPLAANYSVSPEPLSLGWARNVYKMHRSDVITVPSDDDDVSEINARGAVTTLIGLTRSRTKHLRLANMTLDKDITNALRENRKAEVLILIRCEYPHDWDNPFPDMSLRRLTIFGGNRSNLPRDRFREMARSKIETLELVMADFMLTQNCMASLSTMPNLVILSIARTVTIEKVDKLGADIDELTKALLAVIARGTLRELNIADCSKFSLEAIKDLAAALAKNEGRLVIGGDTQRKLLNLQ
jgi:hypothetical protein